MRRNDRLTCYNTLNRNPPMATKTKTKPQPKTATVKRQVFNEVDAQGNIIGVQNVVFWEVIKK